MRRLMLLVAIPLSLLGGGGRATADDEPIPTNPDLLAIRPAEEVLDSIPAAISPVPEVVRLTSRPRTYRASYVQGVPSEPAGAAADSLTDSRLDDLEKLVRNQTDEIAALRKLVQANAARCTCGRATAATAPPIVSAGNGPVVTAPPIASAGNAPVVTAQPQMAVPATVYSTPTYTCPATTYYTYPTYNESYPTTYYYGSPAASYGGYSGYTGYSGGYSGGYMGGYSGGGCAGGSCGVGGGAGRGLFGRRR